MNTEILLIARRTVRGMCIFCLLVIPHSLVAQEHSADSGSNELGDKAHSLVTNYSADFFAGLPDNIRLKFIQNLEQDFQNIESDEERGSRLLSAADQLMTNNFPEQAQRLFRAIGDDPQFTPQTRANAWIVAGEMAPLYRPSDDGVDCFKKSVALIESIPEGERTWADKYVQLLGLAKLANKLYCTNMDSAELPIIYRRILEFEPTHGGANVSRFMTAALDASRVLRHRNDPEEASIYLRLAEKYAKKNDNLSLRARMFILLETSSGLYKWNDPARIKKLKEIWDDEKNRKQPEVMRVGNEILWAMFLERNESRKQFEEFAEEFNKRGTELLKTVEYEELDDVSIYASQGTAVLAVSKHEERNEAEILQLRDQFADLRGGEAVVGRFPGQATREETKTMADAFQKAVTELFQIDLKKPVPARDERHRRHR